MIRKISDYFEIDENRLEELGVFNSFIGIDPKLFVDPALLCVTLIPEFKDSYGKIQKRFEDIVRLLKAANTTTEMAYRRAVHLLKFRETSWTSIGYGSGTNRGNAIGRKLAERLAATAKYLIRLGVEDPKIFELLVLFEEDYGADRLSDMAVAIAKEDFLLYSHNITKKLQLKKTIQCKYNEKLFTIPCGEDGQPILLLPSELLSDLPTADSWYEISDAASKNESIRKQYNELVASIFIDHTSGNKKHPKKKDIKQVLLSKPENVKTLLAAYKKAKAKSYNLKSDPRGEVVWHSLAQEFSSRFPFVAPQIAGQTAADLDKIVTAVINQFKRNIEANGLNEHLYNENGKPRHERFAQLLFYATADTVCSIFDVDVSRETNAGSGSVDFKFSRGYLNKITVEIKLSSNTNLLHGFEVQLPIYQISENAKSSRYLVLRVTEKQDQVLKIKKHYEEEKKKGNHNLPELIVVDGLKKPSASIR